MGVILAHTTVPLDGCTGEPAIKLLAAEAQAMAAAWQIPPDAGLACAGAPLMCPYLTEYVAKVAEAPGSLRPRDSLNIEPSLPTGRLVQALGINGPCTTFGDWPGGGWQALGWALAQLETGRAERFVVGAWENGPPRIVWLYLGVGVPGRARISSWSFAGGDDVCSFDTLVAALEGSDSVSLQGGGIALTVCPASRKGGLPA